VRNQQIEHEIVSISVFKPLQFKLH